MAPEELTHQLAEIDAQKKADEVPNFLLGIFSVLLGGVGGELGCVVGLYFIASRLTAIEAITEALMVGPVFGFLPGLAIGLFCTRTFRGHKAYVSFFYGVFIGMCLSPVTAEILSFIGLLFIPGPGAF